MNNCKNLEQNKCLPPECKWVDKKRKYCRTTKNLTKNKKSNDIDNSNIVPVIGGCEGTRYGCCEGSSIAKADPEGSNCSPIKKHLIGGCAGTRYGCCEGSSVAKIDEQGSNCY